MLTILGRSFLVVGIKKEDTEGEKASEELRRLAIQVYRKPKKTAILRHKNDVIFSR